MMFTKITELKQTELHEDENCKEGEFRGNIVAKAESVGQILTKFYHSTSKEGQLANGH